MPAGALKLVICVYQDILQMKNKRIIKILLFAMALTIGIGSVIYTKRLVDILKGEEVKKVKLWAEATQELSSENGTSYNLILEVIKSNTTVPVILTDSKHSIIYHRNIVVPANNSAEFLSNELKSMRQREDSIVIDLGNNDHQTLYYKESNIITKLTLFTTIQLLVMVVFVAISYLAFSGTRKAEQNKVWIGMSKETAHQLGTPTSSLLGWVGLLKLKGVEPDIVIEIEKDVAHLERIVDRFSKIGSIPELKELSILQVVDDTINYLKQRTSSQINFKVNNNLKRTPTININTNLFEWVLENICKNAIDAMDGKGDITFSISGNDSNIFLDIEDSGKGIAKKYHKTVFTPGYTTKKRGWGLGLSLSKRIVEDYHKGKIFIKESEMGSGTVFRIVLNSNT